MLPEYHQHYQQFVKLIEQLQSQQQDLALLRQSHQKAQQFFIQQILTLEPIDNYQIRSYQTEISKQLQLIGMDVIFLQQQKYPKPPQIDKSNYFSASPRYLIIATPSLKLVKHEIITNYRKS